MARKNEVEFKHLLKSKTFWVNALAVLYGVVEWANGQFVIGATVTFLGAANVALRIVTKQSVKW